MDSADRGTLAIVSLLGAAVFAAWASWAGQDANWDLQNYHRYAAYALLHGRYRMDVGPGGFQAYLNPLIYLPPYWLGALLPARMAAMCLAVAQSVIVPLAWLVAGALQRERDPVVQACAAVAGVASAIAISEIGTSFADLPTASLVLGAVLAVLRGRPAVAGALVGAAAGLKLTNAVFVPGVLLACLAATGPLRARVVCMLAATCGAGFGALLTGGAWAGFMWHEFGNPIFPALNTVFRSSSAAISDFADRRFLPSGWLDGLLYPLRIAAGDHPTAENPFREPRFAALIMTAAATLPPGPWRVWTRRRAMAGLFILGSYLPWLALFAIERYAVALEVLAGLLAVEIAASALPRRAAWAGAGLAMLALIALTRPPDWWRRPWSDAYVPAAPAALQAPAAFVVVSHPNGYWVPAFPPESRFYTLSPMGLATGGVLRSRIEAGLAAPPGNRIWTLGADVPMDPAVRPVLTEYGLVPAAPCIRARSLWWVDTVFCRLTRADKRLDAAADLAPGDTVSFTDTGSGWIYELPGWANAGPLGTPKTLPDAQLLFHVADATPAVLLLDVHPDAAGLTASVNGAAFAPAAAPLCVRPGPADSGTVRVTLRGEGGATHLLRTMSLRRAAPGECG